MVAPQLVLAQVEVEELAEGEESHQADHAFRELVLLAVVPLPTSFHPHHVPQSLHQRRCGSQQVAQFVVVSTIVLAILRHLYRMMPVSYVVRRAIELPSAPIVETVALWKVANGPSALGPLSEVQI